MDGIGKITYADGSIYEGDWADDLKQGHGQHNSASGEIYKGQFK